METLLLSSTSLRSCATNGKTVKTVCWAVPVHTHMVRKSWALSSSWFAVVWRPGFVSSGRLETATGLKILRNDIQLILRVVWAIQRQKSSDMQPNHCACCATGMFLGNCVNAHGEKELGTKRPDFMTPPMKKRREGAALLSDVSR